MSSNDPIFSVAHRLRLASVTHARHRQLLAQTVRVLARLGAHAATPNSRTVVGGGGFWHRLWKMFGRRGSGPSRSLPALTIEGADAIAAELERVAEAPRYAEVRELTPGSGEPTRRSRWG